MHLKLTDQRVHDWLRNRLAACSTADLEQVSLMADLSRSTLRSFLSGGELRRDAAQRLVVVIDDAATAEAEPVTAAQLTRSH